MFCLPQSTARCSSVSPGSETCDQRDRRVRAAIFAASAPAGSRRAAASSLRAGPIPLSEPATATQTVLLAPPGTVTE
jgi:hypothetical protein